MPEFGVGQNGNPWHYSYIMLSPAQKLLALDSIITNEVLPSEELDDHTVLNYTILRRMINQSVEASADDLLRLEEKVMEWASASGVSGPLFSEENVVNAYHFARMKISSMKLSGDHHLDVRDDRSLEPFFFYRRAFEEYVSTLAKTWHINLAMAEQKARECSDYPESNEFRREIYRD